MIIDEVAREDHEVGLAGVNLVDHILHHALAAAQGAEVEVGDLHDAIAIKGFRQPRARIGELLHLYLAIAQGESEEHGQQKKATNTPSHARSPKRKLAMTAAQAGGQGKDGRGQRLGHNQTKGGANEHTFPIVSLCRITLAPRHIYKGYEQADVRQSKEQARTPRPAPPQFAAVNGPSREREQQN